MLSSEFLLSIYKSAAIDRQKGTKNLFSVLEYLYICVCVFIYIALG